MSFKDFLRSCSEETTAGDIASVDTKIPDRPKDPEPVARKPPKKNKCTEEPKEK